MGDRPDRFTLRNGQSQPIDAEIDADDEVLAVADSCPREAIRIVEVSTGNVLAPVDCEDFRCRIPRPRPRKRYPPISYRTPTRSTPGCGRRDRRARS